MNEELAAALRLVTDFIAENGGIPPPVAVPKKRPTKPSVPRTRPNKAAPDPPIATTPTGKPSGLSRCEREILRAISEGLSSQQVAALRGISKRTVDFHLDSLYKRLEVTNRIQAIRRATELGLLPS